MSVLQRIATLKYVVYWCFSRALRGSFIVEPHCQASPFEKLYPAYYLLQKARILPLLLLAVRGAFIVAPPACLVVHLQFHHTQLITLVKELNVAKTLPKSEIFGRCSTQDVSNYWSQ